MWKERLEPSLGNRAFASKQTETPQIDAFRRGGRDFESGSGLPSRQAAEISSERNGPWLRCIHCGSRVARTVDRIMVGGRLSHVFNNPAGYIFEIGCFAEATGCAVRGSPTMEFTWFAGFSWRFALCTGCGSHLGWFYQSMTGAGFYGLILANLVEDSPGSSSKGD